MSTPTSLTISADIKPIKPLTPWQALSLKEWRENRSIISSMVALAFVLFMIPAMWVIISRHSPNTIDRFTPMTMNDFVTFVLGLWGLSSVISGASIVAPEVGKGSLLFLDSLPISRSKVWWIKVLTGIGIMIGAMAASAATFWILCEIGLPLGLVTGQDTFLKNWGTDENTSVVLIGLGLAITAFSVGSIITMLIDRAIPAVLATVVSSVAIIFGCVGFFGYLPFLIGLPNFATSDIGVTTTVIGTAFVTLCLFRISFHLFTQGETLKTRKRCEILGRYFIPPICILSALAVAWLIVVS